MRIKDLARFDGVREQPIIGYGLVVGLSGTGDSQRSVATLQSVSNMLREFGLAVPPYAVSSRNVAAVIVTADLPGAVRAGDRFDVNVAAIGDARSLAGGTLLMTPLMANNKVAYAMAQGPLAVGGYKFEQRGTSAQKNFPTAGTIPEGAIAQRSLEPELVQQRRRARAAARRAGLHHGHARGRRHQRGAAAAAPPRPWIPAACAWRSAARTMRLGGRDDGAHRIHRRRSRHRGARGGQRTHRHGGVGRRCLSIGRYRHATATCGFPSSSASTFSQPEGVRIRPPERRAHVVARPRPRCTSRKTRPGRESSQRARPSRELVEALRAIKVTSRDVIAILQGIKRAGALHAELVIQ